MPVMTPPFWFWRSGGQREAEVVREVLQQVQQALAKISEQLDTYQAKYGS
jgi:hypothetical protein